VKPALAYAPGRSPLHRASPGAAIAYLGALALVGFIYSSPLVLVAAGLATALAGYSAGAGRAVRASLRLALPLLIFMMFVNVLVSHRGDTVLVRGWEMPVLGNTDVTLESLAAGAVIGLRVVAVVLVFAVYSACVDPDRVLRVLRPLAGRSALTATLVSRLVPVAAADASRLRDAARLRGPGAAEVGAAPLARRLLAGSFDRAVDVAATLELRGYGLDAPRARNRRARSRYDRRFYAVAAVVLVAAIAGKALGADDFHTYPSIEIGAGPLTLALSALVALSGLAPLKRRRRVSLSSRIERQKRHPPEVARV
jgi:energy-coupling factor transport system permease protein